MLIEKELRGLPGWVMVSAIFVAAVVLITLFVAAVSEGRTALFLGDDHAIVEIAACKIGTGSEHLVEHAGIESAGRDRVYVNMKRLQLERNYP